MKKLIFMALLLFVASFAFSQNITEKYSEPLLKTDTGIIPVKVGNKWKKMSDTDNRFNPLVTPSGNLAAKDSIITIDLKINSLQIGGGDNTNAIFSKKIFTTGSGQLNFTQRNIAEIKPTSGGSYAFAASSNTSNYITTLDNQTGSVISGVIGIATATDGRANVLAGGDFSAKYTGTRTTTVGCSAYGVRSDVRIGTGYINHAMAYKANPPVLTNGATVGFVWGLYIADVDVVGALDGAAINIEGNGIRNAVDFGVTSLYENIDTFYVNVNAINVLAVAQNKIDANKILNANAGIKLATLSYTPTSSTNLTAEASTAAVGTMWLKDISGTTYLITKISSTKLARTTFAEW